MHWELTSEHLADVGPALPADDALLRMLPAAYAEVLRAANGFTVLRGAYRILGLRPDRHLDLRAWNAEAAWRYAWAGRADGFLCFGGTAFGDQFALRWRPARDGFEEGVHLLDANRRDADLVAGSFAEFFAEVIVANAVEPWDERAIAAAKHFGPLDPSLMLGGADDVAAMVPMDAFKVMTFAAGSR